MNNNNVTSKTTTGYLSKDMSNSFVKNMFGNEANEIIRFDRESVVNSNGYHHNKQLLDSYHESKSFIQQRVERLYGPGALAQGFFVTKRQNRSYNGCDNSNALDTSVNNSHSKSFNHDAVQNDADKSRPMKQSASSPALPVMRHLRPEFRAQLPALSPRRTVASNSVVVLHSASNEVTQLQKSNTVPVLKDSSIEDTTNSSVNGHVEVNSAIVTNQNGAEKGKETNIANNVTSSTHDAQTDNSFSSNGTDAVKDGHYFLQVLQRQADRLLALADQAEELLHTEANLSEENTGLIRSTFGKARLLVSQKMQQFKGLCTNNLTQNVGEAFPTTNEDLQGFWDMVMLQVNQVDRLFEDLNKLKLNKWEEEKVIVAKPLSSNGARKVVNRKVCASSSNNAVAEEARKQRDAERKRLIEERRKNIRLRKEQCANQQENVEIFVPETN